MKFRVMNASDTVKTVKVIKKDGTADTLTIQARGRPVIEGMRVHEDHFHDPNLVIQDLEAAQPQPQPAPVQKKEIDEDDADKE